MLAAMTRRVANRSAAPTTPRLPGQLESAPERLEARDSWFGVRAEAGLDVAAAVPDLELIETVFVGCDLSGRSLTGLQARDVVFDGCDLSGAVLDGARLDRAAFVGCRLSGAALSGTRLTDVTVEDCAATLLNLRAAQAERLYLRRTRLAEADLGGATLTDSAILDCDLTGVVVRGVTAPGLALHGSSLDGLVGADSLRAARIGEDQLVPMGAALVAALGVTFGPSPDLDR